MTKNKHKHNPRPFDGNVYDDDDNVLGTRPDDNSFATFAHYARHIASERGEMVYGYCGNGRDAFEPTPRVGMGCTMSWLNDRHAGTVVKVSPSGSKIVVQQDRAIRTDDNGMSQDQSYRFERNEQGVLRTFHRQGDGSYRGENRVHLTLGVRAEWYCYEQ